jgi:hypothetical protein
MRNAITLEIDDLISRALQAGFAWAREGEQLFEYRPRGISPSEQTEIDAIRAAIDAHWSEVRPAVLWLVGEMPIAMRNRRIVDPADPATEGNGGTA